MKAPRRIGPFAIESVLGRGGMGVVYRAVDDAGARVALKTVTVPRASLLGSIRREIHALYRLRHPAVVRILAEGLHEGLPWYAMELLSGATLRQLAGDRHARDPTRPETGAAPTVALGGALPAPPPGVQRAGWDLPALLRLVRRLCDPLAYIHGEGLVHRDLKPENVLIREDRTPVLMDFGLAAHHAGAEGREQLDIAAEGVGTVWYMAPEQARRELPDARADLYALGCILYEILAGRPPFVGTSTLQVLAQHLEAMPIPPSRLSPGSAPDLDPLILQLLEKDPRRRPGHAEDVARALDAIVPPGPAAEGPRPRAYLYRPSFAGRSDTLKDVRRRMREVARGEGRILLLEGSSGSGKTRLLMALAAEARRERMVTVSGECAPNSAGVPLGGWRGFLQAVADRCRERGADETSALLGEHGGGVLALYEPSLSDVPGIGSAKPLDLPAEAARLRLFTTLARCLLAYKGVLPLLVLLDDLQWADDLTLGFLSWLERSREIARAPVLVVAAFRSEEATEGLAALGRACPASSRLALPRLDDGAVRAIVADMLAVDDPPPPLIELLSRQSEGNPYFVGEYLRTAVGEGILTREDGRWNVGSIRSFEALDLPRSLRGLLGRRLAALGPEARRVVAAAAVLGRECSARALVALARLPESALYDGLHDGLRRQVLEESEDGYRFAHDKIRELGYEATDPSERRSLHLEAATVLEGEGGDRSIEIADHARLGGDAARARDRYLAGARSALARYAIAAGERCLKSFLELSTGRTGETVQARSDLATMVYLGTGRVQEAERELAAAEDEARAVGADAVLGRILQDQGFLRQITGRSGEARRLYMEGLHVAEEIGDAAGKARVMHDLATLEREQGNRAEARRLLLETLALNERIGDDPGAGMVLGTLATIHHDEGDLVGARPLYERSIASARAEPDTKRLANNLCNFALLEHQEGKLRAARDLFEQAGALQRSVGDRYAESVTLTNLGALLVDMGAADEACAVLETAIDLNRQVENERFAGIALGTLACARLESGQAGAARTLLEEAIARIRGAGNDRYAAFLETTMGRCLAALDMPDDALAALERSLALHRKLGDPRLTAFALRNLAAFERARGSADAASRLAGEALGLIELARDPIEHARCLCERARIAGALGEDPSPHAAGAREIAGEVDVLPGSALGRDLADIASS